MIAPSDKYIEAINQSDNVFKKPLSNSIFSPNWDGVLPSNIQKEIKLQEQYAQQEEERKKESGRYVIISDTDLLKAGGKENIWGDSVQVVKKLKVGDVIDVVKSGSGGRGIVATPYLILKDGSYIVAYNAKREGSNINSNLTPQQQALEKEKQKTLEQAKEQVVLEEKRLLELQNQPKQSFLEKHKNHLIIAGAVVLGFLAYKKFKK